MFISDLSYFETTEASSIIGGGYFKQSNYSDIDVTQKAYSSSNAVAIGNKKVGDVKSYSSASNYLKIDVDQKNDY